MSQNSPATRPLVELGAGLSAGFASTIVSHPLDLLKVRLQVSRISSKHFNKTLQIARHIWHYEGGIGAFYRGLSPNLVGNSFSWACYFLLYDRAKDFLAGPQPHHRILNSSDFLLASSSAGALTAIITNPIWVIKTRMLSTPASHVGAYSNILQGAWRMFLEEGIRGFYAGLIPSLVGISHGSLQFVAYEQLRRSRKEYLSRRGRDLKSVDYLLLGGLSKAFAGVLTFPYQVVRTRLQDFGARREYNGLWDVIQKAWKVEGVRGFYRGLTPNMVRVIPSSAVTFLAYERTKLLLNDIT